MIREEGEKPAEGLGAAETRLALRAQWLGGLTLGACSGATVGPLLVKQTAFQHLCAECCWAGDQNTSKHARRASADGGERARGQG